MKYVALLFILAYSSNAISQVSLDKLSGKNDFNKLSGQPLSDRYGQVVSLKVILDIRDNKLYFINSNNFKYHYEFCSYIKNFDVDLDYFNNVNYSEKPDRDYLLANINYFESIGKYVLEISPVDLMPIDQLVELYRKVKKVSYFGNELFLLLNSARLIQNENSIPKDIFLINPSDIYRNLTYQAISKYKNNGKLRIIRNFDSEIKNVNPKDIIVIDKTPIYLPTVSGIIVSEFQTPLSHLTILGQNRKIPICAYKQAFNDSIIKKYENQKITLSVLNNTFTIEPTNNSDTLERRKKAYIVKADLSCASLIDVKDLNKKTIKYVGNKASNFGILYEISRKNSFKVPESAFAIPFYFYNAHIEKTSVKNILFKIEHNRGILNNEDSLKMYLDSIKIKIENTPVDTLLLQSVVNKIKSSGDFKRMRFRSSTNAEDAEGFSGAGLYSSTTGILNSSKKSIEKAIKDVWSSLWSYEAFSEREYYKIKHEDVCMGILVHRSFPSEGVNGVAITKNLYRTDVCGFTINAQIGEESVVRPKEGNICDQFICYPNGANAIYDNKKIVDIITISNLNSGNLIMSDTEIQNLANQLEVIKKYFYNHVFTSKSYLDFGLDIEFKLDGKKRDLYIKQVRVYND